jgi:hypothetical protein
MWRSPPAAEVTTTITTATALRIEFCGPICLKVIIVTSIVARKHLVNRRITADVGSAAGVNELNFHVLRPTCVGNARSADGSNICHTRRRQAVFSHICPATGLGSHACQFDHLIMELHTGDSWRWPRRALPLTIVGRLLAGRNDADAAD